MITTVVFCMVVIITTVVLYTVIMTTIAAFCMVITTIRTTTCRALHVITSKGVSDSTQSTSVFLNAFFLYPR